MSLPQPVNTVTSKNLPPTAAPSVSVGVTTPAPSANDEPIIAKPLTPPDFTAIIKRGQKNHGVTLRLVEKNANGGQRYHQMAALGFVNATLADCTVPPFMVKDGAIQYGDLILMKIDRRTYEGALLHNQQRAVSRMNAPAITRQANLEVQKELSSTGAPVDMLRKIQVFTPGEKETEALLGKD